jgi:hypothetical protein
VPPLDELFDDDEELLDEDELLLDDELELLLELDELLLDDELLELLEDELLELEELVPPLNTPAEAVKVTRSSLAPSSRRSIRSVCEPAARLLKVAGVMVP